MVPYLRALTGRNRGKKVDRQLACILTFVDGAANAGGHFDREARYSLRSATSDLHLPYWELLPRSSQERAYRLPWSIGDSGDRSRANMPLLSLCRGLMGSDLTRHVVRACNGGVALFHRECKNGPEYVIPSMKNSTRRFDQGQCLQRHPAR